MNDDLEKMTELYNFECEARRKYQAENSTLRAALSGRTMSCELCNQAQGELVKWRDAVKEYQEWLVYEQNEMLFKQTNNPPEQRNAWAMRKEQTGYASYHIRQILTRRGLKVEK